MTFFAIQPHLAEPAKETVRDGTASGRPVAGRRCIQDQVAKLRGAPAGTAPGSTPGKRAN